MRIDLEPIFFSIEPKETTVFIDVDIRQDSGFRNTIDVFTVDTVSNFSFE